MLSSVQVPEVVLNTVKALTHQHCENSDKLHAALRDEHDATAAKVESIDLDQKTTAEKLVLAIEDMKKIAAVHASNAETISAQLDKYGSHLTHLANRMEKLISTSCGRHIEIVTQLNAEQKNTYWLLGGCTMLILVAIVIVKFL